MCGLVGLKTTRGRCSFGPGVGERWSGFSVEFAVTRSVRDAAALLDAVAGPAPGDPYFAPPPPRAFALDCATLPGQLRIGLLDGPLRGVPLHPECAAAVRHAGTLLADLGHTVVQDHPDALDDAECVMAYVNVVAAGTARALEAWGARVGRAPTAADVEPLTWAMAEIGRGRTAADHLAALDFVHAFGRRLAAWWESGFDLLCTVTQAAPPPELGWITSTEDEPMRALLRATPYGVFTFPFNMSGQPAISVPLHWTADGLPVGVHFAGRYGEEALLLQLAAQLETAQPWFDRLPSL
jgi:amidase